MPPFKKVLTKLALSRNSKRDSTVPDTNGAPHKPQDERSSSKMQQLSPERIQQKEAEERQQANYERDELKANYGNISEAQTQRERQTIEEIPNMAGDHVQFRARIHHSRPISSKILFLVFRHRTSTIQGLLTEEPGVVSENMVDWAGRLHYETIVFVEGVVQTPKDGHDEIRSTTIHHVEVKIHKLFVIAQPTVVLPFHVEDAARPSKAYEKEDAHFTRVGHRNRLSHRVLELRNPTSQAIFRIHSGICKLFRSYLDSHNFTEIQSSKFQESATESGASVFKVDYFRRPAFLAQSPQMAKQMCIAGDMEKVYEIGPVFRAENSNTHRHMTEFTGLDLEMELDSHYSEVIDLLDSMLLHIFRGLQSQYRDEIELVKTQYPHEELVFPDKTLRLEFQEGVRLLRESGWKEENGSEPGDYDDLSTKGEQRLGQIIKEKYNTDYYILDKFPLKIRPFYTMPDSQNKKLSNSCDFFLRGEEILSGGQRIHDARLLEERMKEAGINPESMNDYLNGFRWGCPPHGGGGIGLERVIMLFLNLHNVRWASLFPRDPRSFAKNDQDVAEVTADIAQSALLKGPKARTLQGKRTGHRELPPLADLIAKYGDATNTSWVDPAWTVWRHPSTGAAIGYIPSEGFAVTFGNPLCEPGQISQVIWAYLEHITEEEHLKPVWCCVDSGTEKHLAGELSWSAVIAVAEERLDPTNVNLEDDKNVRRKIHRAEREGVKLHDVTREPDDVFRDEVEQKLQEWKENRKGTQIHLTGLRPFDDAEHRRYFYAADKDGKICCLVVLAQLTATRGFQIKWALEFPGAPTGAIEYILSDVVKKMGDAGVDTATFGAGATGNLQRVAHIGGFRVRMLEKAYNGLSQGFSLTNKGDFRSKFGVNQEPLYICFPKGSLGELDINDGILADHSPSVIGRGPGIKGIDAIMTVLQKPKE